MNKKIKNIQEFGKEKFGIFFALTSLFHFALPMLKIIIIPIFSNIELCDFQTSIFLVLNNEDILFLSLHVFISVSCCVFYKIRTCYIKRKIKEYLSGFKKNDFIFKKEKTLSERYNNFCLSQDIKNLNEGIFNYYINIYSISFTLLSVTIFYFIFDSSILFIGFIIAFFLIIFIYILSYIFNKIRKKNNDNTDYDSLRNVLSFESFTEFERLNFLSKKIMYIFLPSPRKINFISVAKSLTNLIYEFVFTSQLILPILLSIIAPSEILKIYLIFEVVIFFFYSIFSLIDGIFLKKKFSLQHSNFIKKWITEK